MFNHGQPMYGNPNLHFVSALCVDVFRQPGDQLLNFPDMGLNSGAVKLSRPLAKHFEIVNRIRDLQSQDFWSIKRWRLTDETPNVGALLIQTEQNFAAPKDSDILNKKLEAPASPVASSPGHLACWGEPHSSCCRPHSLDTVEGHPRVADCHPNGARRLKPWRCWVYFRQGSARISRKYTQMVLSCKLEAPNH
jgi:hypothetical protein